MRKLEGVVKEIVDEMNYLKKREERFQSTNGASPSHHSSVYLPYEIIRQHQRTRESKISRGSRSSLSLDSVHGKSSTYGLSSNESTLLIDQGLNVLGF